MNSYPADERRIWEVERGGRRGAVVPVPSDETPAVGDSIVFALAHWPPGQGPSYVRGGDSVRVVLTGVTDLGEVDPATGRALVQLTWEPYGQAAPPGDPAGPDVKPRRPQGSV